jgi:hypothetical protein
MLTSAEDLAVSKVGLFGMILIGMCSLLLGLMIRFFSLEPMVFIAAMAGVLFPMVMVTVGALALWARENPVEYYEFPERCQKKSVLASLAAGLLTASGGTFLLGLTLLLPLKGILPDDGLWTYISSFNIVGYLEIVILIVTYVALSGIGGMLYTIVFPAEEDGTF